MRAALSAIGLCVVALLGSAQARPLADPIVGTWSGSGGGAVSIAATGATTFAGTVTVAYPSTNGCVHQVGQRVWEITGQGGGRYAGTNHGFASGPPACADDPQAATWRLLSGTELETCVTGYGCSRLTRPVLPPTTSASARIVFSVAQDGEPNPPARGVVRSRTTGSGSAVFPLKDGRVENPGKATGTVAHSDERTVGRKRVTLRIAIRLTSAKYRWVPATSGRPRTRVLELYGEVTGSNDRACPRGRRAWLTLRDAGAKDGLRIVLERCRTHTGEQYEVGRRDRVRVRIGEPAKISGT